MVSAGPNGTSVPIYISGTFSVSDPSHDAEVGNTTSALKAVGAVGLAGMPALTSEVPFLTGRYIAPTEAGGLGQFELTFFSFFAGTTNFFGPQVTVSLESALPASAFGQYRAVQRDFSGITNADYAFTAVFPAITAAAPVTAAVSFVSAPLPAPVPLPAGLWLALTGLGALGLMRRRGRA